MERVSKTTEVTARGEIGPIYWDIKSRPLAFLCQLRKPRLKLSQVQMIRHSPQQPQKLEMALAVLLRAGLLGLRAFLLQPILSDLSQLCNCGFGHQKDTHIVTHCHYFSAARHVLGVYLRRFQRTAPHDHNWHEEKSSNVWPYGGYRASTGGP